MKVKLIIISIILLLVMVFASGCIPIMEKLGLVNPAEEEQLSPEKGGPPDGLVKVLIGFKEKPGAAEQALVRGLGGKIKYTYNIIPAIAASVPEVAIEALKKNPNITNVELDSQVFALEDTQILPWGVDRIDAEVVHVSGNRGSGVTVAIIDTGIDNHEDLYVVDGKSFVNYTSDYSDDNGHGTHVAGIVAALDNGIGVVGVAPEAELYALKALDEEGVGYVSDVVYAIQWASDPNGNGYAEDRLDIINMSLGGGKNIFLEWACNLAYLDGLLIVAAAGNSGAVDYPAAYSSVIAVSATDEYNNLASFSSTGKQVELAAPGVNINSTLPGDNYSGETWSGTSMASPHVAGTAALVWKAYPLLSNDGVRAQLQSTAEDIGLSTREQGYGLVDAAEAAPQQTDTIPPAKVIGLTVNIANCAQLDLTWYANTEGDLDYYNVYRSTTSGGSYDMVTSPITNSYSDDGLTASTTYYYVVSAVDTSGNEGDACDEVFETTSVDSLGPVTSNVVAEPNPTNGATFVTLTADVSDVTTGNSNIAAAEYTVGVDATRTPMIASEGTFDSPTERVSIDVYNLTVGQHTLYVHGKDAEGNWGATEPVGLEVTEASSNIMYVDSIAFDSKVAGPNKFLYITVKVVDGDGLALEGVGVVITLTHETSSWYFAGDTGADGMVKFTQKKVPSGFYTATVTELILTGTGYFWDLTNENNVIFASCTLQNDGTVNQ